MKKIMGLVIAILLFCKAFDCNLYAEEKEQGNSTENVDLGIQSQGAILMEKTTGTILYEKNSDQKLSPASITKIMTLILIFDSLDSGKIKLTDKVTTSEYAKSMGGSQVFLETGEQQSVETLIKCIIIASGNDASVTMAEYIAGSEQEFVKKMNERAKGLGMSNTHFEDCCGLTDSTNHYSCAKDVAIMSRELISKYPQIHKYSKIWMENITHVTDKGTKEFGLSNTNKLLKQYQWTTGLKTGSTSIAKYCVSATANKNNIELIAVIMAAPDYKVRFSEAIKLFEYGYGKCQLYSDKLSDKKMSLYVVNGKKQKVKCKYEKDFTFLSTTGDKISDIKHQDKVLKNISAPVKEGQCVGKRFYYIDKKEIGSVNIVAKENITKSTFSDSYIRLFKIFSGTIK